MAKLYKAESSTLPYLGYMYRPWETDSDSSSTTAVCIMNRSDLERVYGRFFLMEALVVRCVVHFTNLDSKSSLLASSSSTVSRSKRVS